MGTGDHQIAGREAFSVIELIVVLVILGLVAVLTIPRFTQAAGPTDNSARLRADLKLLRIAIERYYLDHGAFPAQQGDGIHAAGTEAAFVAQLTSFSDRLGRVSLVPDPAYPLGPYLRDGVPPCPVAPREGLCGVHVIRGTPVPGFVADALQAGWVYNCDTGQIVANSDAADAAGNAYISY